MLGLGNDLIRSGGINNTLVDYTSNFCSSVDGWLKYSVDQGDMAITYNQNPNSDGGPDEDCWLKAVWDTNQTGSSGIKTPIFHSEGIMAGDTIEIDYRIFMKNDDGQFIGSDTISFQTKYTAEVAGETNPGFGFNHSNQNGDEVLSMSIDSTFPGAGGFDTGDFYVRIAWNVAADYAQAGAIVYIKDFTVIHQRPI
tara:strand:- start:705 stop:1292 length:588 start_codon:yes stop_codon:yes gene_type:complete